MMLRMVLLGAASLSAAMAQTPPNLSPRRTPAQEEAPAEPVRPRTESETVQDQVSLYRGRLVQGGLSFWRTVPGSQVFLDEEEVPIDQDGHFILGFGRDYESPATLTIVYPDGIAESRDLAVGRRSFRTSRIERDEEGEPQRFSAEDLERIRRDKAVKEQALVQQAATSYWRAGFDWPVRGRVSTPMGVQRIINDEPQAFHSGTDIAAPPGMTALDFKGTDVRAPSTGRVVLAESDAFFEGGLIFIDHGQSLVSQLRHLSRVDVRPGQIVTKGEVIGAVGDTGRATGPHLHWKVTWQGTPMDPELLAPPMVPLGN